MGRTPYITTADSLSAVSERAFVYSHLSTTETRFAQTVRLVAAISTHLTKRGLTELSAVMHAQACAARIVGRHEARTEYRFEVTMRRIKG